MISVPPARTDNHLNDDALNTIFREARTHSAWIDRPVEDDLRGPRLTFGEACQLF